MMTRIFHAVAGAIILAAAWLTLQRPPAKANVHDPQAQLIDLLQQSGLTYAGRRDIAQGEALLAFQQFGCAAQTAVLYLPWLSRMSPPARSVIARSPTLPIYVNDGEVVGGLGMIELMPRWAWTRLLVLLRLKHEEPWTWISLAVLSPPDCPLPPVDWARLPRG
jgi:hypothetical protein